LCTQIPKGVIFDKKPVKLEVVEGKVYKWCTCGRSKKQVSTTPAFSTKFWYYVVSLNGRIYLYRMMARIPRAVAWLEPIVLFLTAHSLHSYVFTWVTKIRVYVLQPFCDGTHKFDPVTGEKLVQPTHKSLKYEAEKTKTVFFCNCKQTNKRPFCDGTHKEL